jgi:hypothetical protein
VRDLGGINISAAIGPDPSAMFVRVIDTLGVHSFYSVPTRPGRPRLVLRLDDSTRHLARVIFSTDSRRLFFTVTQAESDVWLVELRR